MGRRRARSGKYRVLSQSGKNVFKASPRFPIIKGSAESPDEDFCLRSQIMRPRNEWSCWASNVNMQKSMASLGAETLSALLFRGCSALAVLHVWCGEGRFPSWGLSGKDFVIICGQAWKITCRLLSRKQTPQYWAIFYQYILEGIGTFLENTIYKTDTNTNINNIFNQSWIYQRNWIHILKYSQKETSRPSWDLSATPSK